MLLHTSPSKDNISASHVTRHIYKSCYVEENVDDMQKEEKEEVSGLNNFSSLLPHNIDFLFCLAL
jgi:hypothetical protein